MEKVRKTELEKLREKAKKWDESQDVVEIVEEEPEVFDVESLAKETESDEEEEYFCDNCNAKVHKGNKFCPNCKAELKW